MRISILLILLLFSAFSQKAERDPRLVGKWMMLFSKDANGEIRKDEFYGKRYVETYTKDGRLVLDPQFLRDDLKRNGITDTGFLETPLFLAIPMEIRVIYYGLNDQKTN
jgi:hypothetical protein